MFSSFCSTGRIRQLAGTPGGSGSSRRQSVATGTKALTSVSRWSTERRRFSLPASLGVDCNRLWLSYEHRLSEAAIGISCIDAICKPAKVGLQNSLHAAHPVSNFDMLALDLGVSYKNCRAVGRIRACPESKNLGCCRGSPLYLGPLVLRSHLIQGCPGFRASAVSRAHRQVEKWRALRLGSWRPVCA